MRVFPKIALVLIIIMTASGARAQTQIRVLAVNEIGANLSSASFQMDQIANVVANSGSSGLSFSIVYENFGVPIQLNANAGGSTDEILRVNLRDSTNLMTLRNTHAADIVIVFVDQIPFGSCGWAPSLGWFNNQGMVPASGPDTRGSETHFLGLVSTESRCRSETYLAAHEFGHLLGGAHEQDAGQPPGLLSNSYADFDQPMGDNGSCTVMATLGLSANNCPLPCAAGICSQIPAYSNPWTLTDPPFTYGYRNDQALNNTSYSVSIYRVPQPSCSLTRPVAVHGFLDNPCAPEPWTSHDLYWSDLCEEASDRYQIWAQQPATARRGGRGGYTYRWTVFGPVTWDKIFVRGAPSNVKVKACIGSTCTFKSITTYWAEWLGDECF